MAEVKKPVAAAKKAETKTTATAKKVEAKKAEVKAEVKAVAEKKVAAAKKTVAAAKKTVAKKVEVKSSLNVQFAGKDYKEADLIKMAKDAYKKSGNKEVLKKINVYANIDDQVAYYVANGSIEGKFEI